LAVIIALLLIRTKPQAKPVEVREKAWLVSAMTVNPRSWQPTLTLYGRIESLWSTELTAAVASEVVGIEVIEGDAVAKGQVLVRLDERDARLLLRQREAELREAEAKMASQRSRHQSNLDSLPGERRLFALTRAEVERLENLVRKKVSAQSALDTARQAQENQALALESREQRVAEHATLLAELEAKRVQAEALRDQARLDLERCQVMAPFRGRVARVLVSPGRRVRIGDPLLEVYDVDALVVRAQIPNRHLPVVRRAKNAGQEIRVAGRIDGEPIQASLLGLTGEVASATGGVEALFRIDASDVVLQQGRFTRLDLELPPQNALIALPHEAIYGGDRVYVIDGQSRMRPALIERVGETRVAGNRQVLIRSDGLVPGSQVVTTQLPNAIDGLLVRVPGS
jgi:multidrug resistance efflux pump